MERNILKDGSIYYTNKLSKKEWNNLNKLGLVEGVGNGFANTTEKMDNYIYSHKINYIQIGTIIYIVQYVSGCFYPIWYKLESTNNWEYFNNKIVKLKI